MTISKCDKQQTLIWTKYGTKGKTTNMCPIIKTTNSEYKQIYQVVVFLKLLTDVALTALLKTRCQTKPTAIKTKLQADFF